MTIYNAGDVVVAPFPFTGSSHAKPRPLLVISDYAFNESHDKVMALMITTATRTQCPSDVVITNLKSCHLTHASSVRMKCFTLDASLVTKHLGALHAGDLVNVRKQLKNTLAL